MQMLNATKKVLWLTAVAFLLIITSVASSANDYTLPWWTADGGGGESDGGEYILVGHIGQPDAGAMQSGEYQLRGGFWAEGSLAPLESGDNIFLPFVSR